MKRSAVGVINGNFRSGDYYHYVKSVEGACSTTRACGLCDGVIEERLTGFCYTCRRDEAEQVRILEAITVEAQDEYFRQANEIASDSAWLGDQPVGTQTDVVYGQDELESDEDGRAYVSGGEVVYIGERVDFGSKEWFDNIEPIEF